MPKLTYTSPKGLFQESGTASFEVSGNKLFGHRKKVESITASQSLTVADSGKFFIIDVTAEGTDCVITLPALETALIGTHYTFAVIDPTDGAGDPGGVLIRTGDVTDHTGDKFIGGLVLAAAQASNTSGAANGRFSTAVGEDSQISLDGNLADSAGEIGSLVSCVAVSATKWYVSGVAVTDDANSTGAALIIDKD